MNPTEKPLFLTKPISPRAELEKKYHQLAYDIPIDRNYHFSMLLNKGWKMNPAMVQIPNPKDNSGKIALFENQSAPATNIKVLASLIPREVNPSDWLELWLDNNDCNIIDARVFPTDYGKIGDYLAVTYGKDSNTIVRALAIKDGNRVFAMIASANEKDYDEATAEDFLMAVSSFKLSYPIKKIFAEEMEEIVILKPSKAKFLFPASWTKKADQYNADDVHTLSFYNLKQKEVVGIFTFSSIDKSLESSKKQLLENYLENFTSKAYTKLGEYLIEQTENKSGHYETSILLTDKNGNEFEISAYFIEDSQIINMFSVFSFVDADYYDIHIINKRAFEIACGTFKLGED
jgi:hypothetical protein